jgi:hypothetical protein
MATQEDWTIVRDALVSLCEPLYRAADRSYDLADDHFIQHGMDEADHPGGRAHLARHHLRNELKKEKELGGWHLGRPRPNGEVTLGHRQMKLRLLRPGPAKLYDPFPPPACGRNRARISFYRNARLNLFGAAGSNLIGVWTFDPDLEEIAIRIVRPIRAWKFQEYGQVDIDFLLPRQGPALGTMEFVPTDEDMLLPGFGDTDEVEGEEDADGASG